jgi:RNA polymerase sigma factor (sigma-70 family)
MSDSDPDPLEERRRRLLDAWQERADGAALEELLGIEVAGVKEWLRRRGTSGEVVWSDASDYAHTAVRRYLDRPDPPRFAHPDGLRAYLVRTAQNRLYDALRAAIQRPRPDAAEVEHSGGLAAVDDKDELENALPRLDPRDREILELQFLSGLTRREVCERTGLSKQTVSERTIRALDTLRRLLDR